MKRLYLIAIFQFTMILAVLISCKSDDELIFDIITISKFSARDIGDANNANDILVEFTIENTENLTELRLVLVKSNEVSQFDHAAAQSLTDGNYQTVEVISNVKEYSVRLGSELKDFNGQNVINGFDYAVKLILVSENELLIAETFEVVSLSSVHYLQGKYAGTWDDNFYTAFPISADLTYDLGWLRGSFYYTGSFAACCGGPDDGKISVEIVNDSIIKSFRYDQVLITYMNGCNGTYTGDGAIKFYTNLNINFSGDDCDGSHTGGKIVLRKIE